MFVSVLANTSRVLVFLIYLEVFSLLVTFFLIVRVAEMDYRLILKILILITCERAVGLSLLVGLVRKYSVDNLLVQSLKVCEGY